MTQLDLQRVRQSINQQIGNRIKISANRGGTSLKLPRES